MDKAGTRREVHCISRNVWIDSMRIFFCLYIVLMHSEYLYRDISTERLFGGGYLGVEFFFIVSGFYLLPVKQKTLSYFIKRLKKLYPHFLISILMCCLFTKLTDIKRIIANLFMLQLFMPQKYINGELWFVTVLMFMSVFLHFVFSNFKLKKVIYLFDIAALIIFIIIFMTAGSFDLLQNYGTLARVVGPFLRCFCNMMVGITAYYFFNNNKRLNDIAEKHQLLIKFMAACITGIALYMQFIYFHTRYEFLFITIMGLQVVMTSYIDWNVPGKLFFLSEASYAVYVYQQPSFYIFERLGLPKKCFNSIIILIITVGTGIIMQLFVKKIFYKKERGL